MKKQNSNRNGKVEKMVVLVKTFDHTITNFNFFNCPVKLMTLLNMANCKVLFEKLYTILRSKEPRRQDKTNFSFKMFKIMRSSKYLKTTVKLKFTTQKANACSPWTACSIFSWK